MYLAVDIGGSKTLVAVFNDEGRIVKEEKFPSDKNYDKFISNIADAAKRLQPDLRFAAVSVAAPGKIDRPSGTVLAFGNLPWHGVKITKDLEKLAGQAPVFVENDANLAGLSEALLVKDRYKNVLYLTVSTGIGGGIITNGIIDPFFADSEVGQMVMEHEGKLQKWEAFASGHALMQKYGKLASEINDPAIWKEFVKGLAKGIGELAATLTPEVIIMGGGVGAHYDKFDDYLKDELKNFENDLVKIPSIVEAKRPEEAVIYGCYDFARQKLGA